MSKILYKSGEIIGECIYVKDTEIKYRPRKAIFICRCGNEFEARVQHIKDRKTISCGCMNDITRVTNRLKHNHSRKGKLTSEYRTWQSMVTRCTNPNNASYVNYGKRGIKVCEEWLNSFEQFLSDMGPKPSKKHSLDRINVNGHYESSNCRWATPTEQARNTRKNRLITYKGITRCLSEWAELLGMKRLTLSSRLQIMSVEQAFEKPLRYVKLD